MKCPECGDQKTTKFGFNYTANGKKQRYRCKKCGFTFYDPTFYETKWRLVKVE